MPTRSAPASFAASAAGPSASTATRTSLPVPAGSETVVRICWSLYFGSRLRLPWSSAVSTNLALAVFLSSATASSGAYSFSASTSSSSFAFLRDTFVAAICGAAARSACRCCIGGCCSTYADASRASSEQRKVRMAEATES